MLLEKKTNQENKSFRPRILLSFGRLALFSLVGLGTAGTLTGFGKSTNDLEQCMDVLEGVNPIEVVDDYCRPWLQQAYDLDISPRLTPDGITTGYDSPTQERMDELRIIAAQEKASLPVILALGTGTGFLAGIYVLYLSPSHKR